MRHCGTPACHLKSKKQSFDVIEGSSQLNFGFLFILQVLGLVILVLCLVKQPVLVEQSLAR